PESDITRGMVVTILWRMAGQPAAVKHSFKDVHFSWYDQAISWAFANGIVSGYGPDRFGPENLITREEMAKVLRNYAVYAGRAVDQTAEIQGFGDAANVSGWAVESMEWAVGNGIIGGTNRNTLEPMGQATRAQVAAILQRFIQGEAE
ncbi:MAG TPA: S-layer homology domain-containing protein, partial [Bacillota bacterium]|nr:S-layer homology domain-containing protein [Bacillota bacterium]